MPRWPVARCGQSRSDVPSPRSFAAPSRLPPRFPPAFLLLTAEPLNGEKAPVSPPIREESHTAYQVILLRARPRPARPATRSKKRRAGRGRWCATGRRGGGRGARRGQEGGAWPLARGEGRRVGRGRRPRAVWQEGGAQQRD
ncbi:hypothetical protein GQ55_3G232600 [Panicum hallii var. hallii]|uniref:Uncharacterized protein n=1 Tax=Panicum hallii var. hallii TaxID=1504633 RepID=A0A2T7ECK1_9POAL|nr:hypothetical protein GQ55_3G232600 [Panicum hallii var. hallii]